MKSGNGDKAKLRLAKYNSAIAQSGLETIRNEIECDAHQLGSPHSEVQMLRALEPRVLLDAAALETADTLIESAALRQAENFFANDDTSDIKAGNVGDDPSFDVPLGLAALDDLADTSPVEMDPENIIVFIDRSVADLENLLSSIDPSYEIVLISAESDGVEQIAAHLAERTGIDAIHIISHGRSGTLELGNTSLTAGSINGAHADEMAVIRNALSDDADILIYGCNFADGTRGANAVSALVEATGADIAASLDLTGSSLLGGDWDLEVVSGDITAIALSPASWASTLDLAITNVGTGGAGVTGAGVNALAQQILGSGVTINSATYSGGALQAGTFVTGAGASFGTNILTFGDGAIFSSGTAASVAGPNNQTSFTVDAPGIDGDPQFNALAGNSTFDASFIVINFTPDVPPGASIGDTGRMTMEIVFGSDEYNEYVYGGVNDTLAVIVNGINQAVVPNGLAIGIDTINDAGTFNPAFGSPTLDPNPEHTSPGFESANASLYTNNESNAFNTQMDGFTITLPVTFDVIVGQPNTIKIGIADTGDAAFDSWMFVKADSGQTVIVAENDSVTTPTDVPFVIDVTANDYDLQGDPLTVTHILGQPVSPGNVITLASGVDVTVGVGGVLTIEGDGINTANDAFTYQITDGNGGTSTAFVNVNITAPNSAPVAVDDGPVTVTEDVTSNGTVLPNDSDPDGHSLAVTQFTIAGDGTTYVAGQTAPIPGVGTLEINGDGTWEFIPEADYDGPIPTATYTVSDGFGGTDTADLTFGPMIGTQDAPVANDNGPLPVAEDTPATGNVITDIAGADTDVDGDILEITSFTIAGIGTFPADTTAPIPGVGTLLIETNGDYTFVPALNYNGPVPSTTYFVTDNNGGSDSAILSFADVTAVADAPSLNLDPDNDSGTPGDNTDDGADDGGFQVTYTENDPGVSIVDTDMTISDPENDIVEVVVTLTNGQIGDMFNFPSSLPGNVTAAVAPPTALTTPGVIVLTLTGDGSTTASDWNTILQGIIFVPSTNDSHNPNPADRNITIEASDSGSRSSGLLETVVKVVPENDPPTLDLDDFNTSGINAGNYQADYVENVIGTAVLAPYN